MTTAHSRISPLGFTLIEALITLSIIGILLSFSLPSFQKSIDRYQATAFANRLAGLINTGRQFSIYQNTITTICPSTDLINCNTDWQKGFMLFADKNGNAIREPDESLVSTIPTLEAPKRLFWRAFQNKQLIQFSPEGYTRSQNGTFTYCQNPADLTTARLLILNKAGRLRQGTDVNSDGVQEQPNGQTPNCG